MGDDQLSEGSQHRSAELLVRPLLLNIFLIKLGKIKESENTGRLQKKKSKKVVFMKGHTHGKK